jgi:hypothetical protein
MVGAGHDHTKKEEVVSDEPTRNKTSLVGGEDLASNRGNASIQKTSKDLAITVDERYWAPVLHEAGKTAEERASL